MKVTKEQVKKVLCSMEDGLELDVPPYFLIDLCKDFLAKSELLERIAVTRPKDALTYDRINSLILEARVLVLK